MELLCLYWIRKGELTYKLARTSAQATKKEFEQLFKNGLVILENDFLKIPYLDKQLVETPSNCWELLGSGKK